MSIGVYLIFRVMKKDPRKSDHGMKMFSKKVIIIRKYQNTKNLKG